MKRTIPAEQTPYGVPAHSVAEAPSGNGPLLPFEERQVTNMVNQYNALSPRLRKEFIASIVLIN